MRSMRVLVSLSLGMLIPLSAAGQLTQRGTIPEPQPGRDLRKGAYYALVIGVDRYQHLPVLKTAANDASAVEEVLRKRYGFETRLLVDAQATRAGIVNALSRYRQTLTENDSLLIYYAGHGQYDKDADKAYWLPVDADKDSPANWISADDITTDVRVLPAHHILIVSDSCFSGGLTRDIGGGLRSDDHDAFVQKMQSGKSRTLLSSGGNEPVADAGSNGHSVFANAVLSGLAKMNGKAFTAASLFDTYVIEPVAGSSAQVPQYNVIRNSGHDSGDFVFVPQDAVATVASLVNPAPGLVDSMRALQNAIKTKVNPKDGLTYVWIEPGTFMMGCSVGDGECRSNEKPAHQVTITEGILDRAIGRHSGSVATSEGNRSEPVQGGAPTGGLGKMERFPGLLPGGRHEIADRGGVGVCGSGWQHWNPLRRYRPDRLVRR